MSATSDPKPPIRCLIIQLARLGDTLQSLMALRAAKQLYPQLEIYFLCRERFSEAARRVPWIKEVITLPTDAILGPILKGEKTETETLHQLKTWIESVIQRPHAWDMAVNWSFSDASSYLTGMIPARIKLGYTRRGDTSFAGVDGWTHYIQAVVQGKISQNIHLTDILTTQLLTALQIHAGEPAPEGNSPVTSKTFFSLSIDPKDVDAPFGSLNKKWIAIQLGAGHSSKVWDIQNWIRLGQYIINRHSDYSIVLLGGKEDEERSQIFVREVSQGVKRQNAIYSLVGQTNFDRWTSVVSRCQWLFAGDTAAIHLASVLGTRVVNLSVGPVRFLETGPYGNGHYVISPAESCKGCNQPAVLNLSHTCGKDISAEAAYATWTYASNEWAHRRQITLESHFSQLGWSEEAKRVSVYRSRIRNTHDGGGVVYEGMIQKPLVLDSWIAMVMGHVARAWYCGWVPPVGQELTREAVSPALVQTLRKLEEAMEVLSKIFEQAQRTALALNTKSSSLKSDKVMGIRDKEELQELGKTLLELEGLIDRLAASYPPLLVFSQMTKVLMHNLKGTQLAELGKETANSYKQLNEGALLFKEWIKHTLDLVKPVAIKKAPRLSLHTTPEKDLSP